MKTQIVSLTMDNGQLKVENGHLMKHIQLSDDVAKGMYLVKVIVNDKIFTSQIIYQK